MNKEERLENAVMTVTPQELAAIAKQTPKKTNAGWALAYACRFRGLEYVKALVENGAVLHYEWNCECRSFYWLALLDVSLAVCAAVDFGMMGYAFLIFNRTCKGIDSETGEPKTFRILSAKRRAEIVSYLMRNCAPSYFDAGELLFYSIMSGDRKMTHAMKKMGAVLSEKRIAALIHGGQRLKYREFCTILDNIEDGELADILRNVTAELGGKKLYFSNVVFKINWDSECGRRRLFDPVIFRAILDCYEHKNMPKKAIVACSITDANNTECLDMCLKLGWLSKPRDRDDMIMFATNNNKAEALAILLDYKNRNFDLEAEREKVEKKEQRLLNASPDSVIALRELFHWKKQEDGTVIITGYKGTGTLVKVPSKIGRSAVTAIGEQAFSPLALSDDFAENLCSPRANITEIILPDSIRSIGKEAFAECLELQRINIPDKVRSIGEGAFIDTRLKEIALPDSYKGQGKRFFSSCWVLKSVRLSPNMTAIGNDMFNGCFSLRGIELPRGIKRIGKNAFYCCHELEELVIPEGMEKLEELAMSECFLLKTVVIPASVKKIAENCFLGSDDLTAVVEAGSYAEEFCKTKGIKFAHERPDK